MIDPTNRTTIMIYSNNLIDLLMVCQMVSPTSSNVLSQFTYNSQHLPLRVVDAAGQTNSFGYNTNGLLLTATNALGETATLNYDTNSYLTDIVVGKSPLFATNSFTYDGYGRLRTSTDTAGYTLTFDYDALDRPTKVTYPDGTYDQVVYRLLDPVLRKDRRGHWAATTYDPLRRVTDIQDSLGERVGS